MSDYDEFERLVNDALLRMDRSPTWLAQRLGVSQSTVSRWLNHSSRPGNPEIVVRLADILGLSSERQALLVAVGFGYQEGDHVGSTLSSASRQPDPEQAQPLAEPDKGDQVRRAPHNLPSPATPFVGRRREIDDVLARLRDPACRLLTLVGQGGMGKTRLAIEVARRAYEQEDVTADGVFFVGLETLSRPDQVGVAIASSLGLPVEGADPYGLALSYMAGKRLLLVLDNFEQLVEGAGLVSDILAECPEVKALVTSRETLNLQEEWLYPVGGLDLPDLPAGTEEEARRSAAVQLFLQNAQRARADRDFAAELPCIVRICRMVEGAPLALELAAHWLRTLSCGQIVEQLQQSLDLLATPVRNVPERHRSMRAVFDHSWQLTGQRERSLLCQLAVFVGGFDLPA
ncbi:MAG: helix-turn-helix domain-containing protein, partial [Caldilineaceae bacterium]